MVDRGEVAGRDEEEQARLGALVVRLWRMVAAGAGSGWRGRRADLDVRRACRVGTWAWA